MHNATEAAIALAGEANHRIGSAPHHCLARSSTTGFAT